MIFRRSQLPSSGSAHGAEPSRRTKRRQSGVTLVEAMTAMVLLGTCLTGFISSALFSRRITEASVLHAAASSLLYGIVEQIKGFSYTDSLPSPETDGEAPTNPLTSAPMKYLRIRVNQDVTTWVRVVYTPKGQTPQGPTTCPAVTASASDVGAVDNALGDLPLSTVTGTTSQDLALSLWVWIDEIPDITRDVSDVKKITIVYTYSFMDGGRPRTVRNREVFLRTQYEQ